MTIDVLAKPACIACDRTEKFLAAAEIEHGHTDITTDAAAMQQVRDLNYSSAPVVVVKDDGGNIIESWAGYNREKLQALAARFAPAELVAA